MNSHTHTHTHTQRQCRSCKGRWTQRAHHLLQKKRILRSSRPTLQSCIVSFKSCASHSRMKWKPRSWWQWQTKEKENESRKGQTRKTLRKRRRACHSQSVHVVGIVGPTILQQIVSRLQWRLSSSPCKVLCCLCLSSSPARSTLALCLARAHTRTHTHTPGAVVSVGKNIQDGPKGAGIAGDTDAAAVCACNEPGAVIEAVVDRGTDTAAV